MTCKGLAPVAPRDEADLALKPVECQLMGARGALTRGALCG